MGVRRGRERERDRERERERENNGIKIASRIVRGSTKTVFLKTVLKMHVYSSFDLS